MSSVKQLQQRARQLYREVRLPLAISRLRAQLHHLGRDYDSSDPGKFHRMLRKCFGARIGLNNAAELKAANEKAEYIVKVRYALRRSY